MADATAPAVDRVGPLAPSAPEAGTQASAPSGLSGTAPVFKPTSTPASSSIPGLTATAPPPTEPTVEEKKLEAGAGGAGPALSAPKPVEVMSVPDTPINGSTPAGGTPRPELNIPTEKVELPTSAGSAGSQQTAPAVANSVEEPAPTPAAPLAQEDSIPEPIKDSPGGAALNGKPAGEPAEMAGAIQTSEDNAATAAPTLKRKLEDDKPPAPVNGGAVSQPEPDRAEKKVKVDETSAAPVNNTTKGSEDSTSATTESNNGEKKANGGTKRGMGKRAKKIAEAVVGRTARKTRSQGPAA